ncbi:MAG: hypothetical protein L0G36_12680, partial [Brevibacterium sp.]|nr:hypothetical protein [Brevibacterium sp.]
NVDPATPEAEQPVLLFGDGEYVAAGRENPVSLVRIILDGDDVTRELISCEGSVSDRSTGTRTAWEFQWDWGTGSGTTVYPHPTGSEQDGFELNHVDFNRLGSEETQQVMSSFRDACGS